MPAELAGNPVAEREVVRALVRTLETQYDAVVARSFASPAVTAECAAPLLRLGGRLIVSEPPERGARWQPCESSRRCRDT